MTETNETQVAETPMQMAVMPAFASDDNKLDVFSSGRGFHVAMEMAKMLSESTMVPDQYQAYNLQKNGSWAHNPVGVGNCLVALEISSRMGLSPFTLMQNMDVVKGRPGFRGKFKAGLINHSPLFSRLKYEWKGEPGQPQYGCRAYATERETGEVLLGAWITWAMVQAEKWDNNAKWTTMREQMFMYRSASFWLDAFAPDLTLGLPTVEEIEDVEVLDERASKRRRTRASDVNTRLQDTSTETGEVLDSDTTHVEPEPDAGDEVQGVDDTVIEDAGTAPHPNAEADRDPPFEVTRDTEVGREVEATGKHEPLAQEFEETPKVKPPTQGVTGVTLGDTSAYGHTSITNNDAGDAGGDDLFNVE